MSEICQVRENPRIACGRDAEWYYPAGRFWLCREHFWTYDPAFRLSCQHRDAEPLRSMKMPNPERLEELRRFVDWCERVTTPGVVSGQDYLRVVRELLRVCEPDPAYTPAVGDRVQDITVGTVVRISPKLGPIVQFDGEGLNCTVCDAEVEASGPPDPEDTGVMVRTAHPTREHWFETTLLLCLACAGVRRRVPLTAEDAERWFHNFSPEELRTVADVATRLAEARRPAGALADPFAGLPPNLPTDIPVGDAWTRARPQWEIALYDQARVSLSAWGNHPVEDWSEFVDTLGVCATPVRWLNLEEGRIRDGEGQATYRTVPPFVRESAARAVDILRAEGATAAQATLYVQAYTSFWTAHQRRPDNTRQAVREWVMRVVNGTGNVGQPYPALLENGRFARDLVQRTVRHQIENGHLHLREGVLYNPAQTPWQRERSWPPSRVPQTSDELAEAVQEMRDFGDGQATIDLYTHTVTEGWGVQDFGEPWGPVDEHAALSERTALDSILEDDEQAFTVTEGDLDSDGFGRPETARPAAFQDVNVDINPEQLTIWVRDRLRDGRPLTIPRLVRERPIGVTEGELRRVVQTGLEIGLWRVDRAMCLALPLL